MSSLVALWLIPTLGAILVLLITSRAANWWKRRHGWGDVAAGLLIASTPFIWTTSLGWPTYIALMLLQVWLVIVAARLRFGRLEDQFLRTSTQINAIAGFAWLVMSLLLHLDPTLLSYEWRLVVIASAAIVLACAMLGQLVWSWRHYRLSKSLPRHQLHELPTVSLCIPARNETHTLTDSLMAAIASDYPKLEILVLDDCSQDETSQIIRSFAHDGVRFVQGDQPADGWLGKNQAMKTLAEQASGDYILFMSVDTQLAPQTISRLVSYALSERAQMVSVLPQNNWRLSASTLLGTLQYVWQIAMPLTKHHQPVSGRGWLIHAGTLKKLGGFASVQRKMIPEASFARRLAITNHYRFIISDPELGMMNAKKWSSQVETSIRILYPQAKRQPFGALFAMLVIACLFAPFGITVVSLATGHMGVGFWFSLIACALLFMAALLVFIRTNPRNWLGAALCFPLALLQEAVLVVVSMMLYEFGSVNWKGRNVCYPVVTTERTFDRHSHTK